MILLDDHQPISDAYTPGGVYRVRVGTDERLVDQARRNRLHAQHTDAIQLRHHGHTQVPAT